MARTSLLNTRTANLFDLIGNGHVYRVPDFQRDYSWDEEQWEDLWNDVIELRGQPDDRHYMGAMVVEAKSDREFFVIDGQQRLATMSLFILAVIDQLGKMAEEGVQGGPNRERAAALRNRFIGEKDPASLIETSQLFLNQTEDTFYQDYLVQLRTPLNPRGLPLSNRQLWKCFQYFGRKLREVEQFQTDGELLAQLVTEAIGRQLLFILITVDDELNAYTVFETLNARGLELSTTDLLKNYLFSRVRVDADLRALQRRWRALVATVKQEHFSDFLRYHLLCERLDVRKARLFKLVRDQVKSPLDTFALIDALEKRAELFAALSDPSHGYWAETPLARPHVRALLLFQVRQMTPLLFAVWERFSRESFARVLEFLSTLSFRYSVVSGLNPNALERVVHGAARAVLDGTATTPKQVADRMSPLWVDDAKFIRDFESLVLDTGRGKRLVKYILARLEEDASQRACDPETDPGTIEHILPENPSAEWSSTYPSEQWDKDVYHPGNLTLLEASLNRRVGNELYPEKTSAYRASRYVLTSQIPEGAPQEWTPGLLEDRQRRMAARAAHVWRAGFG